MKKIALAIAVILSINISSSWADNGLGESSPEPVVTSATNVRYVKVPRFVRPLVEKWITEYAKTEPGVVFQIVKGSQAKDAIDLNVVFNNQPTTDDHKDFSHHIVYFGEFAVLPITASGSEAAKALEGKHLNSKKLKQLFFVGDEFEEEEQKNKLFEHLTIYSGSSTSSIAGTFANNFGEESSSFRGKRISGDDLFLNTALEKDPSGVSFNALPNIFDLQSRRLKGGLSLIGLELKKNLEEKFANTSTLDDVIGVLESGHLAEVPVERIGVSYNGVDSAVKAFVEWVLTDGVRYNHEYGLLNL